MKTTKELSEEYGPICIMITSKDRHSEVALLLESLRHQTYNKFNILILDDNSGTPLSSCGFFNSLVNCMKLDGHKIRQVRNNLSYGVCFARNQLIDQQQSWIPDAKLSCRLDDDVILNSDYLERLVRVIDSGFDMSSGVVPLVMTPEFSREIRFVGKIINEHKLDEHGNLVMNNDDCGFTYLEEGILPTQQFRTNALYKTEVHKKVRYPSTLTTVGFREEGFLSFLSILEGYTIGVDVQAIAKHFQTPSGGNRRADYGECVKLDDETFRKWIKEMFEKHGNFLEKYNKLLEEKGLLEVRQ